jgi:hypothetical protein
MRKMLLVLAALAGLAACNTPTPPTPMKIRAPDQYVLNPSDRDRAYVVFGLASDGTPARSQGANFYRLQVTWRGPWSTRPYNADDLRSENYDLPIVGTRPAIRGRVSAEARQWMGDEPPIGEVRYFAAAVLPGSYILDQAVEEWGVSSGSTRKTTNFILSQSPDYLRELAASRRVPAFSIQEGELLYIGNFYFRVSATDNARVSRYDFDPAGAAEFLKRYPGLASPLVGKQVMGATAPR